MGKTYYLDRLIQGGDFRFDQLSMKDIDNASIAPLLKASRSELAEQEICLFHRDVSNGDEYFDSLHHFVRKNLSTSNAAPVVRFADGEYAFYSNGLECNGLYQQAESVEAIKKAMCLHVDALKYLCESGRLALLVNHRNTDTIKKNVLSFLRRPKSDDSASKFIELLFDHNLALTRENYLPFYVVYAYLTSKKFSQLVEGKRLCIINSECRMASVHQWFEHLTSRPVISFTEIPASYVATRWGEIKKDVLSRIPQDTDLCLVGAGAGSLLVCVDVARQFGIPAIDAGHVLNMMNGLEEKSNGPRLYTIHKNE